jgi:flagellar M-ring protein FliF
VDWQGLKSFVAQLGPRRLALIAGAGLAALIAIAFLANTARGPMTPLYSGLDPAAAKPIIARLQAENVPFELASDGSSISVPADRIAELRMKLAGESLGGPIGYGVLDAEQPFALTSARARINEVRAIEGELARSIETLDRVAHARVHIVMPERPLFARDARPATAAVTLRTRGTLDRQAVDAIRNLVASGVPELAVDRVAVVDQHGQLLARAGEPGGGMIEDREAEIAEQLRGRVEDLVGRVVGPGRVRAEVAVTLDRNRVREEETRFDPDGQVLAQQTTVANSGDSLEQRQEQASSVSQQLPDAGASGSAAGPASRNSRKEDSAESRFNNSGVRRVTERDGGDIKRLTVSVLVDKGAADGKAKIGPAELARLLPLVRGAVGYDEKRGDSVVVDALDFAAATDDDGGLPEAAARPWIYLGAGAVTLVAVGGGAFWMTRRRRAAAADARPAMAETAPATDTLPALAMATQGPLLALPGGPSLAEQVGALVAARPAEAVAVLRQWASL